MRIFKLLLLLLGLNIATVQADEFTRLNWNELSIDSIVPYYTQQFSLENNKEYIVRVEYPEYGALTKEEIAKVKRMKCHLVDTVQVVSSIGISRKQRQMDVAILPLIIKDGKYLKLISCKINLVPIVANFAKRMGEVSVSSYAKKSVLSSGKWTKIKVKDSGIYQLTTSALQSMGFANINKVKVYGYGGLIQNEVINNGSTPDYDDLVEVPLYRRDNSLLFYANGTVKWSAWNWSSSTSSYQSTHMNNHYSQYSYYFVTEGENPMAFPKDKILDVTAQTTDVSIFPERLVYEKDAFSWYSGGSQFYDDYDFIAGNQKTFSIATPDVDVSEQNATVTISFTASNIARTNVSINVNSNSLGSLDLMGNTTYAKAMQANRTFVTKNMKDANNFTITTTSGRNARLDYIRINYMRKLNLQSTSLLFSHYQVGRTRFNVSHANSNTRIWRIGKAGDVTTEVSGSLSGTTYGAVVNDATQMYVALDVTAAYPVPTYVETIANQNLHADTVQDMVIIIPESGNFEAQAQRLANLHKEKQGLRVKVVRANEIYNEFSSGTPDATAYRRYLKMLYDRATTEADMPRYLLLFGDCAWDNRMLTSDWKGYDAKNFLLSYESFNSTDEVDSYVTDDYFGLLDDGEGGNLVKGKVDLGIGRFPVRTIEQAKTLVDKVIAYMNNDEAGAWKNTVCMLADDGNSNQHMNDAEFVAKRIQAANSELMVKRIYWDSYKRETTATGNTYPGAETSVKRIMNRGALVMNYCGHGSPYQISHEQVITLKDFEAYSAPRLPLWVVASCEITPFDSQEKTIGEEGVYNKKGAAIGFFSAARAVYSTPNRYINSYFMRYVFDSDKEGKRYTIGDAVRLTKVSLITPPADETMEDNSVNKLKYALIGDPALVLAAPTYKIVVDSLNGNFLTSGKKEQMKAGSIAKVAGYIVDTKGNKVEDFKGTIKTTMMDSEEKIVCYNNAGDDIKPYSYMERTKSLYEGSDVVRKGRFSIEFPIPLDISYSGESGLLNLYALSADKQIEANGSCSNFIIGGTLEEIKNDSIGPKMFVYLNTPEFQDGGRVNETPFFVAQLDDSDGINATGNGVGHNLELIIDGKEETSYVLNDYFENDFGSYTKGSVRFAIPPLKDGAHRLYFRAWDVKNNSSSTVLNFRVNEGLRPSLLDVSCTANPARTSTDFIVSVDRLDTEMTFSLKVYDLYGREVWTYAETGLSLSGYYSIKWDLTSNTGALLPSGLYLFKAGISSKGSKESTKTKKIIILNNK
ncbi:MAG: type IX secretion system sortase PorU [Bacteroidaceae bacterium]